MKRASGYYNRRENRQNMVYFDGTAARRLEAYPIERPVRRKGVRTSVQTRINRERVGFMSLSYALFLTAAIVAMAFLCVNYLSMQSEITNRTKEITRLERQLNDLKLANDEEYGRIMGAVDLEQIKRVAMNDLGMTYPLESQVIAFSDNDSDYVRQYGDISQ